VVAPSSILESSTDAPDDRQLKNLKFQTPLATTKNGFPDTLLGATDSKTQTATSNLSGLPVDDSGIDVYIVGATCGGTASGAIADIGLMIRRIISIKKLQNVEIHGVLVHGTGAMRNVTDVQEANTACLLKELRHLVTPGLGTSRGFHKSPDLSGKTPFDNTLFMHIGNGLNAHSFAAKSRSIAKFLFKGSATAAQFDFREWRNKHEDEFTAADQLRMIGVGTQDAESFQFATEQSSHLCSELLRQWCDFLAPKSESESAQLPAELSDSVTLLSDLQLTDETLPQQLMTVLRGSKGKEIEAFASEVNARLSATINPETITRGEVMDFLSQQLSAVSNPDQGQTSLHQIISGVQSSLVGNTRNCEQAIKDHLNRLLDMPHRIEAAVAAAGFIRATLKLTSRGCTNLLKEIEGTFSELVLEADPDERFCDTGNASVAIATFCQQYCVLLAYQTIYQCFLNHVAAVANATNAEIEKLTALRAQLLTAATELAQEGLLSDSVSQQTIDAFDSHVRSSAPEFLAQYSKSHRNSKELIHKLASSATQYLIDSEQDRDGIVANDTTSFPGNAWPEITGTGGRRRVLGLVPEGIEREVWESKLKLEFGDCVAMRNVADHEMTVVCEIAGVPLDALFGCLTHENPHLVDVASRIHTRTDIEW
ncbi:MAG: tubulin-like doman-containing protein, partial [Fuerstiella sp.]